MNLSKLPHSHLRAGDFQEFLCDIRLAQLVVLKGQIFHKLIGVVGGVLHRHHASAMLAGFGFQ